MVCKACCCQAPKPKYRKGLWSPEEDQKLMKYILEHGHGSWSTVPMKAGLQRNGKSCRLRWINYLRPGLNRDVFTEREEEIIMGLHSVLGNKWSQIAFHLPGRTDNEIKNHWNSHLNKRKLAKIGAIPDLPSNSPAPSSADLPPILASPVEYESTISLTTDASSSSPSSQLLAINYEFTGPLFGCTTENPSSSFCGGGRPSRQDSPPATGVACKSLSLPKLLFSEWLGGDETYNINGQDSMLVPTCNADSSLALGVVGTDDLQNGAGPSCHWGDCLGPFGTGGEFFTEGALRHVWCGDGMCSDMYSTADYLIYR